MLISYWMSWLVFLHVLVSPCLGISVFNFFVYLFLAAFICLPVCLCISVCMYLCVKVEPPVHPISFDDDLTPYSIIPTVYPASPNEKLLSDWPDRLCQFVYRCSPVSIGFSLSHVFTSTVFSVVLFNFHLTGLLSDKCIYSTDIFGDKDAMPWCCKHNI